MQAYSRTSVSLARWRAFWRGWRGTARRPSLFPHIAVGASLLLGGGAQARSLDEFQVYDGRIGEPGTFDLDQHFVAGRRGRIERDGGAPRNGVLATSEIGYTTSAFHEVGVYLPVAREFSGDVFGGGVKVRNTFVQPNVHERPIGLGLDVEVRHQSGRFADANWGLTLRPIIGLRSGPWQLILNPAVEFPLGRGSPVFAPAVRGVRQVSERLWLGVEHYADFGRMDRWEAARRQGQQLFGTADVKLSDHLAVHVGVGHGLTRNSDRWAGKLILRVDF